MSTRMAETFERELGQLNEGIRWKDAEAETKMAAAEKLVEDIRASGVNPLTDNEAFDKVDSAYKEADALKEESSQLRQRRDRVLEMMGRSRPHSEAGPAIGWDGAVAALMSSPEFSRLKDSGTFFSERARVELPPVEILSREQTIAMLRASSTGHAIADVGAIVPDDQRLFPPVPIPVRTVRLSEMITMSTTDSDTVEYVEETTRTDVAAETAPGAASAEATYVYTPRTANVRDISQFTPAHKRNLADAGQVRALLEGRLRSGVERRFETQIVSGDGAGDNLRGILQTSGRGSVTKGGTEPRLEAIHRGITTVRLALFAEPDAVGLHPTDYEEVVFEKGTDGQYLLGPASQQSSRTIWGFPAVITAAFPNGTGVVGNYREGAVAWIRSGVAISASDSHSDFFIKRLVALMAEMRTAFAAWQPRAFAEVLSI